MNIVILHKYIYSKLHIMINQHFMDYLVFTPGIVGLPQVSLGKKHFKWKCNFPMTPPHAHPSKRHDYSVHSTTT